MSKAYFGGVPTALDVRRLEEHFGDLKPEAEITHEEVEQIIGVNRTEHRYRTVTNAWRKHMLTQSNIEIGAVNGIGFRVLSDAERVAGGIKGFQSGTKKQLRAVRRVGLVRTDDEILRRKQDVINRLGVAIASQATSMMKEIEPPKPTQALPKPGDNIRRLAG